MGKVFGKASRILVLDERKGSWAVKQGVEIFASMLHAFFSDLLKWIVLILVWFERSLHPAQVSGQSCLWPLNLVALADPYGRFSSLCTAARPLPSEKIGAPSPISEGRGGCTLGSGSGANVFNNGPLKLSLFTFNIMVSIVLQRA